MVSTIKIIFVAFAMLMTLIATSNGLKKGATAFELTIGLTFGAIYFILGLFVGGAM